MSLPEGSSNEQVWTDLQWWPPDVTSRGPKLGQGVPGLMSGGWAGSMAAVRGGSQVWYLGGGHCTVRSNASWVMITLGPLWIDRQTDKSENTTFSQLHQRVLMRVIESTFSVPHPFPLIYWQRKSTWAATCDNNAHGDLFLLDLVVGQLASMPAKIISERNLIEETWFDIFRNPFRLINGIL